jgi:hypothetical protein
MINNNSQKQAKDKPLTHVIPDVVFNDVDKADLELDSMNSGQSHRLRMKAELEASSHSRGGHAARGGRGGQLTRGGRSHAMPR